MIRGIRGVCGALGCASLLLGLAAFSGSQPTLDDVAKSPAGDPGIEKPAPKRVAESDKGDAPAPSPYRFVKTFDMHSFRRGNIHTHTNRSDGDSSPAAVYTWYRDHGYDFVIVTDHNRFTNPDEWRSIETPSFAIIGGEEITMRGAGRQVHVNALCTRQRLSGGRFATAAAALSHGVGGARRVGAVALINHPNFNWGLQFSDLSAAAGANLIEIESGHPSVHTEGDRLHPSHESLWDESLTAGLDFMGVAVDDAHHFKRGREAPGKAWVEVFAETLDETSICSALENGLLYASTGAKLRRIAVREDAYTVWPDEEGSEVTFVGACGRELAHVTLVPGEPSASYRLTGSEGYVRARIRTPAGKLAFTPPVRVGTDTRALPLANVAETPSRPPG
jgi:hypothetical protein